MSDRVNRMLVGLLEQAHVLAPDDLPALIRRQADHAGLHEAWVYLVDLQQHVLTPLPVSSGSRPPAAMAVDGSVGGRVFWSQQILDTAIDAPMSAGRYLWVPIIDGTERLGVLRFTVDHPDPDTTTTALHLASLVALLLVSKRPFNDTAAMTARIQPMNLAAEMQWSLLPPLSFATDAVVVSAAMEPAYDVGGDTFDYSTAGSTLYLAVFDAMGHDLQAGLVAGLAASAWRYARRRGQDLNHAAHTIEVAIEQQFQRRRYATGVLATLNTTTGELRWVNRGHPRPLLIRAGHNVHELARRGDPIMGMGLHAANTIYTDHLHPGDRLLLYTDGITDAQAPGGERFGLHRFTDFIIRHHTAGLSTPETLRRLIHAVYDLHHGRLRDDASVLLAEWRPADPAARAGAPAKAGTTISA